LHVDFKNTPSLKAFTGQVISTSEEHKQELVELRAFISRENQFNLLTCWQVSASWFKNMMKYSKGERQCHKCK